ncbi:hypothetical protein QNH46_01460 [Paenibacillus woosongensis]|uniref:Antitoxin SocA-like Panacea domain-containing protein n=1 Tax=Paenibacillus woosongensis TaxID=307580 RepID=A0A7X2Z3K4_9BACL|nr:hypothetical protein [Paenibacillus woosongensis]MUG46966.1 hypothetical protein [Paenibacillus woosongensis]WHX49388.1 hypothetical protein QNH46_01460 [Paenibacillus woosongensis]
MLIDKSQYSSVPSSIELLFENDKLDIMKILCLIYALSVKRQRYIKASEILFYFALVNYNLIGIFGGNDCITSPNLYFRFQARFKPLLISMEKLGLLELNANVFTKPEDIKFKITIKGRGFFEENKSEFFIELQEKYLETFELVKFTSENSKKLKEGKL